MKSRRIRTRIEQMNDLLSFFESEGIFVQIQFERLYVSVYVTHFVYQADIDRYSAEGFSVLSSTWRPTFSLNYFLMLYEYLEKFSVEIEDVHEILAHFDCFHVGKIGNETEVLFTDKVRVWDL